MEASDKSLDEGVDNHQQYDLTKEPKIHNPSLL